MYYSLFSCQHGTCSNHGRVPGLPCRKHHPCTWGSKHRTPQPPFHLVSKMCKTVVAKWTTNGQRPFFLPTEDNLLQLSCLHTAGICTAANHNILGLQIISSAFFPSTRFLFSKLLVSTRVTNSRYKSLLARVLPEERLIGYYMHILWWSLTFIQTLTSSHPVKPGKYLADLYVP